MDNIRSNLFYAILAQFVTLIVSAITSIGGAVIFGKEMQGFWQLFLFYLAYTGFFHFGLIDGIYLKLGGKTRDELDQSSLFSQFIVSIIVFSFIAVSISCYAFFVESDALRRIILYLFSFNIVIANAISFIGIIFQSINEVKQYSISILIEKIIFVLFIGIFLLQNNRDVVYYMGAMSLSRIISLVYLVFKARPILFGKFQPINDTLIDMMDNIKIGINLMLANIAGTLIIGISRFMIDSFWGTEIFGEVSLSLSLINFFLVFISQASLVLFPGLRRSSGEELIKIYNGLLKHLTLILWALFIFYPIAKEIVIFILPHYENSVLYLSVLLPIALYESKVQLVYNTYFKVLRKEKMMFMLNVITVVLSFILSIVAIMYKNINYAIIGILISIIFRSIIANILLDKSLKTSTFKYTIFDIVFTICFISIMAMKLSIIVSIGLFGSIIIGGIIIDYFLQKLIVKNN